MKCEHAVDLIIDSLLDSVNDEQARELAQHIEGCRACAAEADKKKDVWEGMAAIPGAELDPGVAARAAVAVGLRAAEGQARRPFALPLRTAASVALLLLGAMGGYLVRGPGSGPGAAPPEARTFLFLVRGEEPDARFSSEVLTAEYRAWAAGLAGEGRLVAANKLMDEPGRWVSGSSTLDDRIRSDVQGYFLISAPSYSEAVALAEASPHIRYGGTFEIRQVEPTG